MCTWGESLVKVELTKIIGVPKEEVVKYFSDPRSYLKVHSRHHRLLRVLSGQRNIVYIDEDQLFEGRQSTHKTKLDLPDRIDMAVIGGEGERVKETITFEELWFGTKVTYTGDFKLRGPTGKILGWLVGKQIRQMLEEMAEKDRSYLERKWIAEGVERQRREVKRGRSVEVMGFVIGRHGKI